MVYRKAERGAAPRGGRDRRRSVTLAFAILCLAASPALAQPMAAPVQSLASPPQPSDCAGLAAERAALEAEHQAVRLAIADIAMGRTPRRGPGAGAAGRAAGGAAASLLLPFGIGLAVNAGAAALDSAGKKKKRKARPPAPEPDVPALIARQQAIEARLAESVPAGCAPNGVAAGR